MTGEMADAEAEQVPAAYLAHLAALGPAVPDAARRLTDVISLHDGLLRGVERTDGRLELLFRAGDEQVGYFDAWLRYDGAGIAKADAEFLKSALGNPEIELLYDEFDRHEKDWVHHLLFWLPGRRYQEVSIRFAVIDLQVFPAAGRFDGGAA
jgi:hypothetical protein